MRLGLEHEARHLARFPRPHRHRRAAAGGAGATATPSRGRRRRAGDLPGRACAPRPSSAAARSRSSAIPDFMLPARRGYAIRDSKLARRRHGQHQSACSSRPTAGCMSRRSASRRWRFRSTPAAARSTTSPTTAASPSRWRRFEQILAFARGGGASRRRVRRRLEVLAAAAFASTAGRRRSSARDVGLLPWADRGSITELHDRGVHTVDAAARVASTSRRLAARRAALGRAARAGRRAGRADPDERPRPIQTGEPIRARAARDPRARRPT